MLNYQMDSVKLIIFNQKNIRKDTLKHMENDYKLL